MLVIDSGEKDYVFEALDKMEIDYIRRDIRLWFCSDCDKIYKERPSACECGENNLESETVGDITNTEFTFVIERKKGMDLYSSLNENRIYIQMENIAKFFNGNMAVVFEGSWKGNIKKIYDNQKKGIMPTNKGRISQMMSLPAVCMQYGVSFIQIDNSRKGLDDETVEMRNFTDTIKMAKFFDSKSQEPPKLRLKLHRFSDIYPKRQIMFQTPKGVGPKTSLSLASNYPSVAVFCDELRSVELKDIAKEIKGLGVKGLEKMREWFI